MPAAQRLAKARWSWASRGAVPSGENLTVNGTLDLDGNSLTVQDLAGSADAIVTSSQPGAVTLTVAGNGQTTTFAGSLEDGSGQLALVKSGSDELILTGTNSFSGPTTVSAGILDAATIAAPRLEFPSPSGRGSG